MKIHPFLFCVILTFSVFRGFALSQNQPAVQLPDGIKAVWDIGKAHRESTPAREAVCINGLWRWQPAVPQSEHDASASATQPANGGHGVTALPSENWGYFKVPGS